MSIQMLVDKIALAANQRPGNGASAFNSFLQKIHPLLYLVVFLVLVAVFQFNFLHTSSEFQFRTYRDGSEALVLGKIFADQNGLKTDYSHMGFVEKEIATSKSNVLAVYEYLDYPNGVVPMKWTDANWTNGFSNFDSSFLLPVADVASLGYASNELTQGQEIIFPDGQKREVSKLSRSGDILTVSYSGPRVQIVDGSKSKIIKVVESRPYVFTAYPKQFGVQAVALSWLYRHIPVFRSVFVMQLLMSILLAIVLTLLIRELSISISTPFATIFFLSMIGSPWVVAIARNLYWTTFLWFLPAVFAMMIYRAKAGSTEKTLLMAMFLVAVFVKCLTGYEYISTVIAFSLFIFLVDPFRETPRFAFRDLLRVVLTTGGLAILAFVMALLVHAMSRASSLMDGLSQTLGWDALKYSSFASKVAPNEPQVSIGFVLNEYVNGWTTPIMFGIGGKRTFAVLIGLCVFLLTAQFCLKDRGAKRDAALLVATVLAPLSWYVLLPLHSAIHTHLNYVLWYFGFIPALIFVIFRSTKVVAASIAKRVSGVGVRSA